MSIDCSPTSAPASQEEGVEDDGFIPGPADVPPVAPPPPDRRYRGRAVVAQSGSFCCWIIGDPAVCGPAPAAGADEHPVVMADEPAALGMATVKWSFVLASQEAAASHRAVSSQQTGRSSRAQAPWGYIEYRTVQVWPLVVPMPVPRDLDLGSETAM